MQTVPGGPVAGATPGGQVEPDPRDLPWDALRRLALEAGLFVPPYRPVSRDELSALLDGIAAAPAGRRAPRRDEEALAAWRRLVGGGAEHGAGERGAGAGRRARGGAARVRTTLAYRPLGDVVAGEAGLGAPAGLEGRVEPELAAWRGRLWLAATPRWRGRLAGPGSAPASVPVYDDWPPATARDPLVRARDDRGRWRLDWPRAVGGIRLGRWALTAGLAPARVGPGITGVLTVGDTAPPVPAVTLRRTAPFRWRGWAGRVAPRHLLLRAGLLSEQTVVYEDEAGRHERRDRPWLLEWLVTFRHASWLRTTLTGASMAVPRRGTLWPDLVQLNFPLLSATWTEAERGPITDRLFSAQLEARFRDAPWPLLPAAAGRVWWEYAGEDFRPHDTLRIVPEIAAPASVVGVELVGSAWDLSGEYVHTDHPRVLWYSHSSFTAGFTHRGWVLGHPAGGAARGWRAAARIRPGGRRLEIELAHARWRWGEEETVRVAGRRHESTCEVRPTDPGGRWAVRLGIVREESAGAGATWLWSALTLRRTAR